MLSNSMKQQVASDKTGNVWIKSVILRFNAICAYPFRPDRWKSYMLDNWGLTKW